MHHAGRFLANAFALLLASGCVTGIDVGHDGNGGGTTTSTSGAAGGSTTSSGGGGQAPTGAACTSPGALLCDWGWIEGPCGAGGPDCDAANGWVCMGASPGAPGTCGNPGQPMAPPGGACGAGVPNTPLCPWNYVCDAPIQPDGVGTCVPRNCVLSGPTPFVSTSSINLDGDGPTQHDDFACTQPYWGSQITGEAGAFLTPPSAGGLALLGCSSTSGDVGGGAFILSAPLTAPGTAHTGTATYYPPPAAGDMYGDYVFGPDEGPGDFSVTVTSMTPDHVSGSFDVVLEFPPMAETKHLTGTFDVCRLPDHASNDW